MLTGVRKLLLLVALITTPFLSVHAAPSPEQTPQGKVILTVKGNITNSNNADGTYDFDLEMLEALPQVEFATETPWTEGVNRFRGPRMSDLLKLVGAKASGEKIMLVALNDYIGEFDVEMADQAIIATRMNSRKMRIRKRGPLWVMFPLSDRPELNDTYYHHQMAWQLRAIDIR